MMKLFTEKKTQNIFIGSFLIVVALFCSVMAFISFEAQPLLMYGQTPEEIMGKGASVRETGAELENPEPMVLSERIEKVEKIVKPVRVEKKLEVVKSVRVEKKLEVVKPVRVEKKREAVKPVKVEKKLVVVKPVKVEKKEELAAKVPREANKKAKMKAVALAMNTAASRVEDSIPRLVVTEKVVADAEAVVEPKPVEPKQIAPKQEVEKEVEEKAPAEEVSLQEGLMWVDRKESKLIVTLGNEHGVSVGDHMAVFQDGKEVGFVQVEKTLDVVSYVSPKLETKFDLTQDYYQVKF
ncbi:hypothetical protein ACFL49_00515 [Candidatus Omnitrophota bacterium]